MEKNLEHRFKKYLETQDKREKSYFIFIRHITTISIGFLGLLVGLKPDSIESYGAKYLFLITISLIGLGILFSVITQFYEVYLNNKQMIVQRKIIKDYIDKPDANSVQMEYIEKGKIFVISEIMTFVCLGISILSLTAYVFFLELN